MDGRLALLFPPDSRSAVLTRLGAGVMVGCCLGLLAYAVTWQLRRVMAGFESA
nr:hypothetical protein GCM10020093_052310 [Planobispora longispora]